MFIIRILFGLWGIVVVCGAIDSALTFLNAGKVSQPISYQAWNRKLHGNR